MPYQNLGRSAVSVAAMVDAALSIALDPARPSLSSVPRPDNQHDSIARPNVLVEEYARSLSRAAGTILAGKLSGK